MHTLRLELAAVRVKRALERGRARLVRPDVQQARAFRQQEATLGSDTPPPPGSVPTTPFGAMAAGARTCLARP